MILIIPSMVRIYTAGFWVLNNVILILYVSKQFLEKRNWSEHSGRHLFMWKIIGFLHDKHKVGPLGL